MRFFVLFYSDSFFKKAQTNKAKDRKILENRNVKGRVFLKVKNLGFLLTVMALMLSLTACVKEESTYQEGQGDENMGNSRMIVPEDDIVVDPPVVTADPTNPDMTGLDGYGDMYGDGMMGDVGTGIMGADGMSMTTVEPGYVNDVETASWDGDLEAVTVASWEEMVAHSKYRATTNGKVYDPTGTETHVHDLWTEAKESIDEAGDDLKKAMENLGTKSK